MDEHETNIWQRRFERERVQFVVLNRCQDRNLVKTLQRQAGWSVDFDGDGTVILSRSEKGEQQ